MNFLFAWRYFKSKKSVNAINIIAWVSIVAITVGTAALIIVLSVFNGFEDLVKSLYADFYTDVKVTAAFGKTIFVDRAQLASLQKLNGVQTISLVAEEKALLVNGENQSIVLVKGVDEQYASTNKIKSHILRGSYSLGNAANPEMVAGAGIENAAALDVERGVAMAQLYFPDKKANNLTSFNSITPYNIKPVGTFMVQQDFDNKYVFTNLSFVKNLLNLQHNEYSAIEIKLTDATKTDAVKKQVDDFFQHQYKVQSRYEQNQSLYKVMVTEKWIIYGILSLILVVAAFNMIGALTMMVLEKQKDIAVLRAMGASAEKIRSIFLNEGILLAGVGASLGMLIAYLICFAQLKYKLIKLNGESFIIDYYPVKLLWSDFVLVLVTVFCIALTAAWMPSRKSSEQFYSLKS